MCQAALTQLHLLLLLALQEVLVRSKPVCGLPMQNSLLTWLPRGMSLLAPSFIGFFVTSTGWSAGDTLAYGMAGLQGAFEVAASYNTNHLAAGCGNSCG